MDSMRVIVSTSNSYAHLLPIFTYLFNREMNEYEVTIVGYDAPACKIPPNFTFHSMGKQGSVNEWSTDLRKYFESIDDEYFIWMMEDSFARSWDEDKATMAYALMMPGVGRIDLTNDVSKRPHTVDNGVLWAAPTSRYRLSTQPSIWCREFLLQWLTDGMTPWTFEVQDGFDDKWQVCGLADPPLKHNEGVRKHDPHALDLNGFDSATVAHINELLKQHSNG